MNALHVHCDDQTSKKLVDIESKDRLSARTIDAFCHDAALLSEYLRTSQTHTFSELLFRLTHEVHSEDKAFSLWKHIVVHSQKLEQSLGRDVGVLVAALDYLTNISGEMLNPKIIDDTQLEDAAELATRDALTGLYSRNVFDFSLARMVLEHNRYRKPLSLLIMDIDDFKHVNDDYGHQAGDDVLKQIGQIVLGSVRKADFPARYGGEEVSIVFPETPMAQATAMADRLCRDIHRHFEDVDPGVTVSIGVACANGQYGTTSSELLRGADRALYLAKSHGKDNVVSSD